MEHGLARVALGALLAGCSVSTSTQPSPQAPAPQQTHHHPSWDAERKPQAEPLPEPPVRDEQELHAPFEAPDAPHVPERTIKIATFNIQTFGKTKASRPATMSTLAAVIRAYDVVAVQEIKDVSGKAPESLLAEINKEGPTFAMSLSPRTGQQPDDKGGAEQYAFFYNTETIRQLTVPMLYNDAEHDYFQREPWAAWFAVNDAEFSFVLVNIHTAPERAVKEISALAYVAMWAQDHYTSEDDVILLGDFNAGCDYASPDALKSLAIRSAAFQWLVPDDADTNIAESTCAYDRIVTTSSTTRRDWHGTWGVDQAFTDSAISDHHPVWAEFWIARDKNEPKPLDLQVEDLSPKPKAKPAPKLSDAQIKKILIRESISSYPGNCPCPYNRASNGSSCGGRSAWSRGGGYAPLCYAGDVSKEMIDAYRNSSADP